jgi:chromosome segregation ATPase
MAHENDPNKIIFEHNLDDLLASAKKLKTELDGLSKSEQNLKRQTQESSNAQRQQAGNFKNLTAETEKLKETQEQLKFQLLCEISP